jgi:hypothetical protein
VAKLVIPLTVIVLTALLTGCDRDDSIRVYQAPKDPQAQNVVEETAPTPATQPVEISAGGARMMMPAGWQRQPDQQMRVATFRAGDAEVIITTFGAESFASLLPNINRWRGQVGLEPISDANEVKGEDGAVGRYKAKLFDFTGPEKRLHVAVVMNGPSVWYFKLQGPTGAVAQQLPSFDQFLRSVQLADQSEEHPQ